MGKEDLRDDRQRDRLRLNVLDMSVLLSTLGPGSEPLQCAGRSEHLCVSATGFLVAIGTLVVAVPAAVSDLHNQTISKWTAVPFATIWSTGTVCIL